MNVFNRMVIVLALLVALVVVTVIGLFPDFAIQQAALIADWLEGIEPRIVLMDRLILIAIAVVVDFGLLILLVLELRRPKAKAVRLQNVEGGTAEVSVDSIQKRLAFYIDGLEGVVSARPRVDVKRDTVDVAVEVQTAAAVNVPAKAREVVAVIRMVIVETMGLKLRAEPKVSIRTGSYKDLPMPVQPLEPAVAAPEPATPAEPAEPPVEPTPEPSPNAANEEE